MNEIEVLKPIVVVNSTPRCEAIRVSTYASDTPKTDKQCRHNSTFRINRENLCRKHAGQRALDILMKKNVSLIMPYKEEE